MTDPTPLCESLMFFCPFIFATRSEAKNVSFGTPQNHGILKGRTFCDVCDFRNSQEGCHNFEHNVTASDTTFRPLPCTSLIFEKNANFEKKSAFFTIAIEKVTARTQNADAQEVAKSMLPIRILFLFLHFFSEKLPGVPMDTDVA